MLHSISYNSIPNTLNFFLIFKFSWVAAYKHDLIAFTILCLKLCQLWECMNAVNAAVSPEVDKDKFAS